MSLFWFSNLSHPSPKISFVHLLQFLFSCGITTPILKDFFQLKGTLAINLWPLNTLKHSCVSKLSETLVNHLKVLCSSITPHLYIVKQYFILGP